MKFSTAGAAGTPGGSNRLAGSPTVLVLAGAVVLACVLRFLGLTDESYWLDELYSADFSAPGRTAAEVIDVTLSDVHPPLYQLLLWCWYHIFGYTEFSGRSLSAVLGTLSVPVFYVLGRDLFSRRAGVAAAAISAVGFYLVRYSQEARSYELLVLLSGLSWWCLYRVLDRLSVREFVRYLLATVLLIYTHYISFFFIAAQFSCMGLAWLATPAQRKRLFLFMAAAAVVLAAAVAPLVPHIAGRSQGEVLFFVEPPSFFAFVSLTRTHFGSIPALMLALAGLVALLRLFSPRTPLRERRAITFVIIWASVSYVLLYIQSVVSTPILLPRYALPLALPVVLLGACGISCLALRYQAAVVALFAIFSVYILAQKYYFPVVKDDFRQVVVDVAASNQEGTAAYERIPFNGHHHETNHFQVYANLLGLDMTVRTDGMLEADRAEGSLPACFWLLDANYYEQQNPPFNESSWARSADITLVQLNSYHGAESALVSTAGTGQCESRRRPDQPSQ